MAPKQFYQKSGAERKREHRQRAAAAKLDSELNTRQLNCSFIDTTKEILNEVQMEIDDFHVPNENDDYQLGQDGNLDMQHVISESLSIGENPSIDYNCHDDNDVDDDGEWDDKDNDVDDDGEWDDKDNDDSDNDINDFINLFDGNREKKLYESSTLSIYEGCMEVIKLSRDLNLNKLRMQRLLNGLRRLLPLENKLPLTVRGLLRVVGNCIFVG